MLCPQLLSSFLLHDGSAVSSRAIYVVGCASHAHVSRTVDRRCIASVVAACVIQTVKVYMTSGSVATSSKYVAHRLTLWSGA